MMSRKRKSSSFEVPCAASEFHPPCKSSLREFGSFSGPNGQGNSHDIFLNQEKSWRPETMRHQFQSNQFQPTNDFEEARFTSGPVCMMPESSQFREPSPLLKMPAGETEQPSSLSVQRLPGKNAERSLLEAVPEGQMRSWDKDRNSPETVQMGMSNVSTEFVRPEGPSLQSSLPNGFCDDSQTSAWSKEANESENSSLLRQSNQFPNNSGTVKFPYEQIETVGASGDAGQMEKESSLQSKIRSICSSPTIPLDVDSESRGAHGVGDFKLIESSAAAKKLETPVTSMSSSKHVNNVGDSFKHGHSEKLDQDSKKLDGKSTSPGKRTSMGAEKLWEGSLQLNSSIKVSAVAFFKSGEKLLDINWSEFVEVKGKVRLEAFEKYIQDLPRSRTRGLMVISLCWKEGSSESGLKGMKEVAKSYRKGERVGLARLSPGVDVYLCPRSNTIITILAKHGFFKGKAAVEDNSELLIGCVVWRKHQTTACSTEKRSDNKGKSKQDQLLKSPSDTSSNQQAGERSSSFAPPVQNSKSLASVDSSSVVENVSVTKSKNVSIGNHIPSGNFLPTPSVPKVSSIPVGQQNPSYSTLPIEGSKGQPAEIGAASARCSEAEYPKASLGVPRSIVSGPANMLKERIPSADVDDLPEFDFGNTDETSMTSVSKPLDVSAFNKSLQHEGNKNSDFMMPPKMAAMHAVSVSNPRASNSSVHQLPSTFNPEIPVRGCTADHDKMLIQQRNDRSRSLQTNSSSTFASAKVAFERFGKKNLFDDDDDMPEWIPPEQEKTPSAEVKEPSLTISSSNSSSRSLPVGTSVQPRPSPFPDASLPEYSSQAFRPSYRPPPHVKILPPVPPKHVPSSLTGFTFTPLLRPPSSSPPIQRPLLPAGKRGSRPQA